MPLVAWYFLIEEMMVMLTRREPRRIQSLLPPPIEIPTILPLAVNTAMKMAAKLEGANGPRKRIDAKSRTVVGGS
jgi:hypothetical protein